MGDRAIYTTDTGTRRHTREDCSHFYTTDTTERDGRTVRKSKVRLATEAEFRTKPPCQSCAE
jgi:hypothetical protein